MMRAMEESPITSAGAFPPHFTRMEKPFDSSTRAKQFARYSSKYVNFSERWKNRTSAKGFGDLRSTTKLIAQFMPKEYIL